jgi:ABC-type cobalt transport system substrate-binding protein
MIYSIIAFFALAAVMGMILLSYVLKGVHRPRGLMVVHGLLAVAGLVLLLNYIFKNEPGPVESAVLFVIAALGGIVMGYRDLTGKSVPKALAVVHGLLAVTGFVFLLVFTFSA